MLLFGIIENVRHGDFQAIRDRLQRIERDILLLQLNSMQCGRGDAHSLFELSKCRVAPRFAKE